MNTRNKASTLIATLGLASALLAGGAHAQAAPHSHEHAPAAEATALTLDHGRKWAIDAPLGRGMGNIRQAIGKDLAAIHRDRLPAERYKLLAGRINEEVAYMVANCHLKPEADAQLHLIIARLLDGAAIMDGSGNGRPRDGAVKAIAALDDYATYFDDPDFRRLAH